MAFWDYLPKLWLAASLIDSRSFTEFVQRLTTLYDKKEELRNVLHVLKDSQEPEPTSVTLTPEQVEILLYTVKAVKRLLS